MSMFSDIGTWVAVAVIVALVAWGLVPRRAKPNPTAPPISPPAEDPHLAAQVGVVTGVMGGSIEDAAKTKYALSRLDHPPTAYDTGVAAGIQSSAKPD
jgi:hypothetical protein